MVNKAATLNVDNCEQEHFLYMQTRLLVDSFLPAMALLSAFSWLSSLQGVVVRDTQSPTFGAQDFTLCVWG
jgi:hypothetical protein